ncbi:hypothetical protein KSP39_PZI002831 [Platanthera zijinensis]|uniref:Uncharacterized protein n=1 Tax=Platanthera zijinensis TaxID=2320716 RepID=A0AAP0GEU7_9ASPA
MVYLNAPTPPLVDPSILRRLDGHDDVIASLQALMLQMNAKLDDIMVSRPSTPKTSTMASPPLLGAPPDSYQDIVPPSASFSPVPRCFEVPSFNDTDPLGWIVRMKQVFDIQQISEPTKSAQLL